MKAIFFAVALLGLFAHIQARVCLVCNNARSNNECLRKGRILRCQENEDACQNEIRRDDRGIMISKRCKQSNACNNNFVQNPRDAWAPVQCNMGRQHTVCRCCCFFDSCNQNTHECPNDCPPQKVPTNGERECTFTERYTEENSRCSYKCNRGYTMKGKAEATCLRKGDLSRFTSPPPLCIQRSCQPHYRALFNGAIQCTEGNGHGSVCRFKCNYGFLLVGASQITCQSNNKWSMPRPLCRSIRCYPKAADIENGSVHCSNRNMVGSVCKYTCDKRYEVEGPTWVTCNDDGDNDRTGRWSSRPPTCKLAVPSCKPKHVNPVNGFVSCSDDNYIGSVCTFACNPGYGTVGSQQSTCGGTDDDPRWDNPPPTCQPITCLPRIESMENGEVNCTEGNALGSVCNFTCGETMKFVGAPVIVCEDDGDGDAVGAWSDVPPTCTPLQCSPPLKAPANGAMSECSATEPSDIYDFCLFECDDGFIMQGTDIVNCEQACPEEGDYLCDSSEQIARWDNKEPTCEPILCPEREDLLNGAIDCTAGRRLGSVCTHTCNIGHNLNGQVDIGCNKDPLNEFQGKWTHPPPVCEPVTCVPRHIAPDFGTVECSNDNFHGSVCLFACPELERQLIGSATSTCVDDQDGDLFGNWDNPAPVCELVDCREAPAIPESGTRLCSDGQKLGSVCEFKCSVYHDMIGAATSTCVRNDDGTFAFDNPPPTCVAITCEEQGPLENGKKECSGGNLVESRCAFSCDEGYELHPPSSTENVCALSADGSTYAWNIPMPCCALPCPPNALVDVVMAVEFSEQSALEWNMQRDFVSNFVSQFNIGADDALVSVFRYGTQIDADTEVPLNGDAAQMASFLAQNAGLSGAGTSASVLAAMEHMLSGSFTLDAGDRPGVPNVAVFVTMGAVADTAAVEMTSSVMREAGIEVYAVGVGMSDASALVSITGDASRTATVVDSSGLFNLVDPFTKSICPNPCA